MVRASPSRSHLLAALALTGGLLAALPAAAQSNVCQEGQKYFVERQNLVEQLTKLAGKNKQLDPRGACPILTKVVANGEGGIKWLEGNKDWCQVPGPVAEGFANEVETMKKLRTQACAAAAKMAQMEKQARQQQQQQGGGLLGGGGLTGEFKVPQGAL